MNNEMISITNNNLALNGGDERFISFMPETMEDQRKLYRAINSNNGKVSDLINKKVMLADVMIEQVTIPAQDGEPGEMVDCYRSTLIMEDGTSYGTISNGIRLSLQNLAGVFGTLHFDPALPIMIQQVETKKGRTYTIQLV